MGLREGHSQQTCHRRAQPPPGRIAREYLAPELGAGNSRQKCVRAGVVHLVTWRWRW